MGGERERREGADGMKMEIDSSLALSVELHVVGGVRHVASRVYAHAKTSLEDARRD